MKTVGGSVEGRAVREAVGRRLGTLRPVGSGVGLAMGRGVMVGRTVGALRRVGRKVGFATGLIVGSPRPGVGSCVGLATGWLVGTGMQIGGKLPELTWKNPWLQEQMPKAILLLGGQLKGV